MDSGYYAASAGLQARTQALDFIANNLANVETPGFRGQQSTFRSVLAGPAAAANGPLNRAINDFGVLGSSRVDLASGNLQPTGNPLDLALAGEGFFAVDTPAGVRYTRQGNFRISVAGQLVTAEGHRVLGESGPLLLAGGAPMVGGDGTLSVKGAVAGKLRLVQFPAGTNLTAESNALYAAPENTALPAKTTQVLGGTLESSNVQPLAALAALITVQRQAEMMQRAITLFHTEFHRIAATELPRV
jgi:flagellar basal-body rod protein FlgF/flagellar basal-body rod protein FlgG